MGRWVDSVLFVWGRNLLNHSFQDDPDMSRWCFGVFREWVEWVESPTWGTNCRQLQTLQVMEKLRKQEQASKPTHCRFFVWCLGEVPEVQVSNDYAIFTRRQRSLVMDNQYSCWECHQIGNGDFPQAVSNCRRVSSFLGLGSWFS